MTYQEAGEGVFLQQVEFEAIGAQQEQARLKAGQRNRVPGPQVRYANLSGEWLTWLPEFHVRVCLISFFLMLILRSLRRIWMTLPPFTSMSKNATLRGSRPTCRARSPQQ